MRRRERARTHAHDTDSEPVRPRPPRARVMSSQEGRDVAGEGRGEGGATPAPAPARKAPLSVPVRYCAVYDCLHNYRTHPHLSFFGFPSDKKMVKIWVEKIRRPDIVQADGHVSGYYRVCEAHFERKDINPNRRRRRLLRSAVPALRLPHAGPYVSVVDTPPSTTQQVVAGRLLVRSTMEVFEYVEKRKTKKLRDDKSPLRPSSAATPPALDELSAECDQHLAPGMAEFVKLVTSLKQDGDSNGMNELCLKLLHSSPPAYRLLRSAFDLPTIRSLHRYCTPLLYDFDTKLTQLLKTRIDRMTEKEKQCTLSVEFIDVRPHLYYNITFDRIVGLHEIKGKQSPWPATRAAVVSARGLLAHWTQPVALSFLAREDVAFDPWLENIISGLTALGLTVRALVSDPASAYATTEPAHFFHVGDAKIYRIYDTPGLFKMLLCNFMAYDFNFERSVAKWSDVLEYRKLERHKQLTLTPRLTEAGTDPARVRRMRPARAARVLDRALAAGLSTYLDRKQLPESTLATVHLILKLNNLYDVLNSTTMKTTADFKKGLFNNPGQVGFLEYMRSFFKSLKLENEFGIDHNVSKRLSESWQTTITSVLSLHEDLKAMKAPLLTRRLHLDNKIGESARRLARQRRGKPTCRQVFEAFKKHFFDSMLQSTGREKSERDLDLNGLLARVAREPSGRVERAEPRVPLPEEQEVTVRRRDYCHVRLPAAGAARAAAAVLLRAARRQHKHCERSRRYVNAPPEDDLVELVRRLDEALAGALQQPGAPAAGLLRELLLDLHVLDCELPCECFPLERLKLLFLRLRLYTLLRHNQARFNTIPNYTEFEINTLE